MLLHLIRKNWLFFLPYAVLLVVVGLLQLMYSQAQLMQWVNIRNSLLADRVFPYITYLGDGATFVIACVLLVIFNWRFGAMAFGSFLLSSLTSEFLKKVVFNGSPRPLKYFEHSTFQYHLIEGLDIHSYNSFPSGHTISAFAMFSLFAFLYARKELGWFFLFLAALTGFSRVYLFQHFVEDVYAGSVIGTVSSVIIYLLMRRWVMKGSKFNSN
ncbi:MULTISPECIES: phosphatase PAP2 family protein [unclassified Spirosoma]|uniref:phosphatase PAP2 family protein n=1 Tax=unclassified Spirosoma TaxID=2621999 RepID=UPI00095B191F|nr:MULTISPECIES: phosphatase PAP2 family protein [unclassified Spirosoma]MBN8824788.1 phosphatase PAP2 family protein [Spirosoma sp.]OJW77059.1 MAG: PA-phosphatase [Spirosoma sp. 48-14]